VEGIDINFKAVKNIGADPLATMVDILHKYSFFPLSIALRFSFSTQMFM